MRYRTQEAFGLLLLGLAYVEAVMTATCSSVAQAAYDPIDKVAR
jgi:hypothetical protein